MVAHSGSCHSFGWRRSALVRIPLDGLYPAHKERPDECSQDGDTSCENECKSRTPADLNDGSGDPGSDNASKVGDSVLHTCPPSGHIRSSQSLADGPVVRCKGSIADAGNGHYGNGRWKVAMNERQKEQARGNCQAAYNYSLANPSG